MRTGPAGSLANGVLRGLFGGGSCQSQPKLSVPLRSCPIPWCRSTAQARLRCTVLSVPMRTAKWAQCCSGSASFKLHVAPVERRSTRASARWSSTSAARPAPISYAGSPSPPMCSSRTSGPARAGVCRHPHRQARHRLLLALGLRSAGQLGRPRRPRPCGAGADLHDDDHDVQRQRGRAADQSRLSLGGRGRRHAGRPVGLGRVAPARGLRRAS